MWDELAIPGMFCCCRQRPSPRRNPLQAASSQQQLPDAYFARTPSLSSVYMASESGEQMFHQRLNEAGCWIVLCLESESARQGRDSMVDAGQSYDRVRNSLPFCLGPASALRTRLETPLLWLRNPGMLRDLLDVRDSNNLSDCQHHHESAQVTNGPVPAVTCVALKWSHLVTHGSVR